MGRNEARSIAANTRIIQSSHPVPTYRVEGDRRGAARIRTVYRVATAARGGQQGMVRIRNISDGGMRLETALPVELGDRISVAVSEKCVIEGRVIWTRDDECGIQFDDLIDSIDVLRSTAREASDPQARPPRMPLYRHAVVFADCGMRPVRVRDISQRGMKIEHSGGFQPGMSVKVVLDSGVERRGVIRWSRDGHAGIMLTETFTPAELGRLDTF